MRSTDILFKKCRSKTSIFVELSEINWKENFSLFCEGQGYYFPNKVLTVAEMLV